MPLKDTLREKNLKELRRIRRDALKYRDYGLLNAVDRELQKREEAH